MNFSFRKINKDEIPLLDKFLYNAIFIPNGVEPPSRDIINLPELRIYLDNFGDEKDDNALVAIVDGEIVGAVWTRIMNDYGHIDNETPSLAISLLKEYRGLGIGTKLMTEMLNLLQKCGYKKTSLAVQK